MKTFNVTKHSLPQLHDWAEAHLEGGEYVLTYTTLAKAKTEAQNNTFHDLLDLYWKSGEATKKYDDYDHMRNKFKVVAKLIKEYVYADEYCKVHAVKTRAEIPSYVMAKDCRLIVDSWANVTKRNAAKAIQALIDEMLQMGVSGIKFDNMILQFNNMEW